MAGKECVGILDQPSGIVDSSRATGMHDTGQGSTHSMHEGVNNSNTNSNCADHCGVTELRQQDDGSRGDSVVSGMMSGVCRDTVDHMSIIEGNGAAAEDPGRKRGDYGLNNGSDKWFEVWKNLDSVLRDNDAIYTICAKDVFDDGFVCIVDIFHDCLQGLCNCVHFVGGAPAQLKPCRIFVESMCRGDCDPDWEYLMRGALFGFKVINEGCESCYRAENYSSITNPEIGPVMTNRLIKEISEGLLTVVDHPCTCIHALGGGAEGSR